MSRGKVLIILAAVLLCLAAAPCVFADTSDDDAITVYVTISDDGEFVKGVDGTVMAHVPVRISYFDLADYGLSEYYRYEAAPFKDGGDYISNRIIKEPTLLHLYIKVLEQYYAGRPLTAEDMHSDIIDVTGSATHVFLQYFWGHNYNLMYFVDHAYPLQAAGWGSTCDYIILYDGTEIDLAMFTDMSFNITGAFTCFDRTEATVSAGESVTLTLLGTETKDGGGEVNAPVPGEPVRVSSDHGASWDTTTYGATDQNGKITLKFDKAGTYYVSAGPKMVNYPSESGMPDTAPPISVITVKGGADDPDQPDQPDQPDRPDDPDKPDDHGKGDDDSGKVPDSSKTARYKKLTEKITKIAKAAVKVIVPEKIREHARTKVSARAKAIQDAAKTAMRSAVSIMKRLSARVKKK